MMGGSINPQTDDPEFSLTPTREFNFWMDPEATHAVLHAKWPRVVLTTVDISVKTHMEKTLIEQVKQSPQPAAQYVAKYAEPGYLWDELAAVGWLHPGIITKWHQERQIDGSVMITAWQPPRTTTNCLIEYGGRVAKLNSSDGSNEIGLPPEGIHDITLMLGRRIHGAYGRSSQAVAAVLADSEIVDRRWRDWAKGQQWLRFVRS